MNNGVLHWKHHSIVSVAPRDYWMVTNHGGSALVRIPFTLTNPNDYDNAGIRYKVVNVALLKMEEKDYPLPRNRNKIHFSFCDETKTNGYYWMECNVNGLDKYQCQWYEWRVDWKTT